MTTKPSFFTSRISLRLLLTLFLVSQIVAIAGLVAYVSFRNGQAAVNTVAAELRDSLSQRIEQHLINFLEVPHTINQNNVNLIRSGSINETDIKSLQAYFLDELGLYPSVTSIYFGNEQGGIAGGGREGAGNIFYTYNTPDFKAGTFEKYSIGMDGNTDKLLTQVPNFDARTRAWYVSAIQNESFVWSDIYVVITGQEMALAASAPIYDKGHDLIGVTSVDIFLSLLSSYLHEINEPGEGECFIMERSGLLVASSTNEALSRDLDLDGILERVDVHQSETPLLRHAADAMTTQFGNYRNIRNKEMIQFDVQGERQFLQVSPLRDEYGIDWLIVVISSESAFMGQIQQNNRLTMTIIVLAVIASIGLSLWAAHKVIRPISRLVSSMHALKNEEWDGAVAQHTRIYEINELSLAFNHMRAALREMMQKLSNEIHERHQAEALLRQSEDQYRTLVQNIPVGVFRVGANGIILATNPAFRLMFGLAAGTDPVEFPVVELFADPHQSDVLADDLISKGSLRNVEIECKKMDGSSFWGSIIVRSVFDANGEVIYFDGTIQDVSEQKMATEALQYLVTHDVLTSIPNRAFFEDQLFQAITLAARRNTGLAVLFLDLDDFKAVNDTFGHLKGDQLLQLVAQRISSCVRVTDVVARFGGDEFAVFLDGLSRDVKIRPIVEKIMAALSQPFFMDGREVYVTASIGVSIFPQDGTDLDALIHNADHAMYRSKVSGKNGYNFS